MWIALKGYIMIQHKILVFVLHTVAGFSQSSNSYLLLLWLCVCVGECVCMVLRIKLKLSDCFTKRETILNENSGF